MTAKEQKGERVVPKRKLKEAEHLLAELCARAATPTAKAEIVEILMRTAGRAIAIFCEGDAKKINILLEGCFHYMETEASLSIDFAKSMAMSNKLDDGAPRN